jgi:TorA maturation chaperone TorD
VTVAGGAAEQLLIRAVAYGACARLVSPRLDGMVPGESVDWLRRALQRLGLEQALAELEAFLRELHADPEGYRAEYFRVFERGAVPPYEASCPPTAPNLLGGPNLQQIADVAGFYRAFGFEARGERPDHLAAELEFVAWTCAQEAHARLAGREEEAETCARARDRFVREHLDSWVGLLADRVRQATPRPALHHLVALLQHVVQADAASARPETGQAP